MPPRIPATMACAGAHQEALGPVRLHVEDEPREEGEVAPGACVRTSAGRVCYSSHAYESHANLACAGRDQQRPARDAWPLRLLLRGQGPRLRPRPRGCARATACLPRALNALMRRLTYADALVACIHPMGVRAQARSPPRTPRRSQWSPSRTRLSKRSSDTAHAADRARALRIVPQLCHAESPDFLNYTCSTRCGLQMMHSELPGYRNPACRISDQGQTGPAVSALASKIGRRACAPRQRSSSISLRISTAR